MAKSESRPKRVLIEQRMRRHVVSTLLKQTRWLSVLEIVASAEGRDAASSRVDRWKRDRKIFAVPVERDGVTENRYPAYQFDDQRKPCPMIAQVLRIFSGKKDDPWKIAAWFGSNNGWLRGCAPKDCLHEPKRVIEAAKHEIEPIGD